MNELVYLGYKFLWDLYLAFRQKSVYRTSHRLSLPDDVQQIFDEEAFLRARAYSLDRVDFLILKSFYDAVLNAGFIVFNIVQLFWNQSEELIVWAGFPLSEALTSCVFVFLMNSFNTLTWLPVEIHAHFFLEEKHGFNRMSVQYFAKDKLKSYLLSQLGTVLITFVAVEIMMTGGDYFYLHLWVFLVLMSVIANAVYSDFIAPIFDTFYPIPDGELKNKIEALTDSVNFPVNRVFILDSSKRTYHSDAYHVGIYKSKRIVLFDSLLRGHPRPDRGLNHDEVLGVLGHELGHWNCNHILKLTLISLFVCLIMLIIYGPSMKEKFVQKNFGLSDFHPVLGLCLVLNYFLPSRVGFFGMGLLWVSRSFERQADDFAGSLGLASHLRRALIKVHRDNLLFPAHDWLYSLTYDHHPCLLDRLRALDKYD